MLRLSTKLLRAGGAGFAAGFVVITMFALWASTAHAGNGSLKDDEIIIIDEPLRAWHGCYIGFSAGGNIDDTSATIGAPVTGITDQASDGLALGAYTGCSLQTGGLVLGIEADINTASGDPSFFGSVRGRVGFAPTETMLLYVTGGYAFADQSYSALIGPAVVRVNETVDGVVYGGGVEFAMGRAYGLRVEALHYDYDTSNAVAGASVDQSHTVIRFGVTIQLAGGFFGNTFGGPDPDVIQ